MPKFYNKDSSLTDYSLSCGYIERSETLYGDIVTLEKEHGAYHVKRFRKNDASVPTVWVCPETLTDARYFYRKLGGKYNKVAHCQYEMAQERLKWLNKNG